MITVIPAYMHKLETESSDEVEPIKNAIQSVSEVIVIEGPEWAIPCLTRSLGLKSKLV